MGKGSRIKLTKTVVDQAGPQAARHILWDSVVPGFGIRIEPSAIKTYFVRYRADGGGRSAPQRLVTVGRHGLLTVEEARQKAKVILGEAAIGEDPAKRKAQKRRELSMSDLIDLYEEEGCFIQRGKRQGEPMKELTRQYTLEARFRDHLVEIREWAEQTARWQAERTREEREKLMKTRVSDLRASGALMREAAEIRALVAEVEMAMKKGSFDVCDRQLDRWRAWALGEADRLDPIKSGQVLSHLVVPELDAEFER